MTDRDYILKKVKNTVLSFDENARIILYGSRAKGAASADSDWDFLILTDHEYDYKKKQAMRKKLHSIEIETDEILSVIIHSIDYWNSSKNSVTPFCKNIREDSITL